MNTNKFYTFKIKLKILKINNKFKIINLCFKN